MCFKRFLLDKAFSKNLFVDQLELVSLLARVFVDVWLPRSGSFQRPQMQGSHWDVVKEKLLWYSIIIVV